MSKSKPLNAKTTPFCPSDFEFDLTFEPCHLDLFRVWILGFGIGPTGLPRPDKSGLATIKARMTNVVPGFSLMLDSARAGAGLPG
jgi:hypothetical protein